MSRPEAFGTGEAVVSRIDQGYDTPLTWEQVKEVVEHPTAKLTRRDLVEVVAYLGAQLHGARSSVDRDAATAMVQIGRIVGDYSKRHVDGES